MLHEATAAAWLGTFKKGFTDPLRNTLYGPAHRLYKASNFTRSFRRSSTSSPLRADLWPLSGKLKFSPEIELIGLPDYYLIVSSSTRPSQFGSVIEKFLLFPFVSNKQVVRIVFPDENFAQICLAREGCCHQQLKLIILWQRQRELDCRRGNPGVLNPAPATRRLHMSHISLMVPSKLMKFHHHFPETPPMAVATFGSHQKFIAPRIENGSFYPNHPPLLLSPHDRSPHQTKKRSDKNPALSVFLFAFPADKFPLGKCCARVSVCVSSVCGDIIPNQSDQYCDFLAHFGGLVCVLDGDQH